jgi:hypothetical protein
LGEEVAELAEPPIGFLRAYASSRVEHLFRCCAEAERIALAFSTKDFHQKRTFGEA